MATNEGAKGMTPTLEQCLMYTEVFKNIRMENILLLVAGILMGVLLMYPYRRDR